MFLKILAGVIMAAVVVVLYLGLRNMMKDGSANKSNQMMQLRVILQALAIVVLVAVVYFGRPS
jgi:succinate dehydrogenase hydrophobic anchor subunit